jgi:hypothetical protein
LLSKQSKGQTRLLHYVTAFGTCQSAAFMCSGLRAQHRAVALSRSSIFDLQRHFQTFISATLSDLHLMTCAKPWAPIKTEAYTSLQMKPFTQMMTPSGALSTTVAPRSSLTRVGHFPDAFGSPWTKPSSGSALDLSAMIVRFH